MVTLSRQLLPRPEHRYRAWRFDYPGAHASPSTHPAPSVDVPEAEAGLRLNGHGGVAMVEGSDAIRQSILLLLSTVPGERVMRPDYGCNLHWLLFSPNDDSTAGLAIHYVRQALERWEPRIDILKLDAERNQDYAERLDITLHYRVRAIQQVEQLTFSLSLAGEED